VKRPHSVDARTKPFRRSEACSFAGVLGAPPSFGGGPTMRAPTPAERPAQRIDPAQMPRPAGSGDGETNVRAAPRARPVVPSPC